MSQHTSSKFDEEFELFKQSSYYHLLSDDGSEWHKDVRATIMAAFIDLIMKSTNPNGPYVPEISRFCYFGINQRADQSEVHISLYTDMLPEYLSVDHNPRKLFLALNLSDQEPEIADDCVVTARSIAGEWELTEIVDVHSACYPSYMHPLDSMPHGILQFLADEGYRLMGHRIDWMNPTIRDCIKGPLTLFLKNDQPNRKYPYLSFTYNHQVFIEDYQWISENTIKPEENHG